MATACHGPSLIYCKSLTNLRCEVPDPDEERVCRLQDLHTSFRILTNRLLHWCSRLKIPSRQTWHTRLYHHLPNAKVTFLIQLR